MPTPVRILESYVAPGRPPDYRSGCMCNGCRAYTENLHRFYGDFYRDPLDASNDRMAWLRPNPIVTPNGVFSMSGFTYTNPNNWAKWSKLWRAIGVAHVAAVYMIEAHPQIEVNSDTKEEFIAVTNESQILRAAGLENCGAG